MPCETIVQKIQRLEKMSDRDTCDGDCDSTPPFDKCPECKAGAMLNEIGEMLDNFAR